MTDAHTEGQAARASDEPAPDPDRPAGRPAELRDRYNKAVDTGIIHNRHRDRSGDGNHHGFALAVWLRDYADQVWHFTTHLDVDWSSNAAERGVKPANDTKPSPATGRPTKPSTDGA